VTFKLWRVSKDLESHVTIRSRRGARGGGGERTSRARGRFVFHGNRVSGGEGGRAGRKTISVGGSACGKPRPREGIHCWKGGRVRKEDYRPGRGGQRKVALRETRVIWRKLRASPLSRRAHREGRTSRTCRGEKKAGKEVGPGDGLPLWSRS